MEKVIARDNVRFVLGRLETETDSARQSLWQRILKDQEDKLGHDSEALHAAETHIASTKEHVNRQQALVASGGHNGHDAAQVLTLLNAYSEILLAFEGQREKILRKLGQSSL